MNTPHLPPNRHSERSRPTFFLSFGPARFLRPGWFCGTKGSACGCEDRFLFARILREESLLASAFVGAAFLGGPD